MDKVELRLGEGTPMARAWARRPPRHHAPPGRGLRQPAGLLSEPSPGEAAPIPCEVAEQPQHTRCTVLALAWTHTFLLPLCQGLLLDPSRAAYPVGQFHRGYIASCL